jgi:hypothetical protein
MRALLPACLLLAACTCGHDSATGTGDPLDTDPDTGLAIPALELSLHPDMATLVQASWSVERPVERCWLRYGFEDDAWFDTPVDDCDAGEHSQAILGIPPQASLQVQLVLEHDGQAYPGPLQAISTGALPADLLTPVLEHWDPALASGEPWLLLAIEAYDDAYYDGPYWQLIVDRQGRVVWYRALPSGLSSTFPRPSRAGSHIVTERVDRFGLAGGQPAVIQRVSLDLTHSQELEIPGLRFPWDEAGDGSIYYFDREAEGEAWLSRLAPDGTHERLWDCAAWIADRCTDTWCCEANAVVIQPSRGSLLWSMWATDTVLEIDLSTTTVLHSWGQLEGSWATDPSDAVFELQHYPDFTAAGTLMISTHTSDMRMHQVAREFELDEHAEVLRQVWSHTAATDLYAQYQGEAVRLANGNTLLNYGSAGALQERDASGELAWSIAWPEPWMLGHTTLIPDLYALSEGP